MAAREFLIKNQEFTLSELASVIKDLTDRTEHSEYPAFELLPAHVQFKESFNWSWDGKSGPMMEAGEEFILLRCSYTSAFNEMCEMMSEQMRTALEGVCTLDLEDRFKDYLQHIHFQRYDSLDELIQKLQQMENRMNSMEERIPKQQPSREKKEEEKRMEKGKEQTMAQEQKDKKEYRVYLSLPSAAPKAFTSMIQNLKEAGAKYDGYNRAWYITSDMDFNKFKGFLGLPYEQVNERGKRLREQDANKNMDKGQEERNSVMNKLEKNREAIEKQHPEKKEPEYRKQGAR